MQLATRSRLRVGAGLAVLWPLLALAVSCDGGGSAADGGRDLRPDLAPADLDLAPADLAPADQTFKLDSGPSQARLLLYPLTADVLLDTVAEDGAEQLVNRLNGLPGDGITVEVGQATQLFYRQRVQVTVWDEQFFKLQGVTKQVFVRTATADMVTHPLLFSDDARWALVLQNLRDLLLALKKHGFHWLNDTEGYPAAPTAQSELYSVALQGAVHDKADARGVAMGQAIDALYPGLTVLSTVGPYMGLSADPKILYADMQGHTPARYELLAWLWAGMFEGSPHAVHVDGGKLFPLRPGDYQPTVAYRRQLTRTASFNHDDALYDAWQLGFGIYDDTVPANHPDAMTPTRFRQCVDAALAAATPGAWVWAQITSGGPAYDPQNPWTHALSGLGAP